MERVLSVIAALFDVLDLLPFISMMLVVFLYSSWKDNRRYRRREGIYRRLP